MIGLRIGAPSTMALRLPDTQTLTPEMPLTVDTLIAETSAQAARLVPDNPRVEKPSAVISVYARA